MVSLMGKKIPKKGGVSAHVPGFSNLVKPFKPNLLSKLSIRSAKGSHIDTALLQTTLDPWTQPNGVYANHRERATGH